MKNNKEYLEGFVDAMLACSQLAGVEGADSLTFDVPADGRKIIASWIDDYTTIGTGYDHPDEHEPKWRNEAIGILDTTQASTVAMWIELRMEESLHDEKALQ